MRKTTLLVLIFLLASVVAEAGMPNPFRRRGTVKGGMFPDDGDVPELVPTGKLITYAERQFTDFYGDLGKIYSAYGIEKMTVGEYTYGGKDKRVTVELATMENAIAAAGIFHYHRGKVIGPGKAKTVEVGAEGVVDNRRGGRNLYFYRANIFGKVLYSGKEPVPDLTAIARYIDGKIPPGRDAKPEGFAYIRIDGVTEDTIGLTPGFCFSIDFMPPAVFASAPGGGSIASDLFLITRNRDREAADLFNDYTSYLKLFSEYHEEYKRNGQRYVKAQDPNQGRVVYTAYRHVLIIAARPDGYEKGEALIDKVIAKIDEVNPPKKRK